MGAIAALLKHAELAARKGLKGVFATVEVPQVKVAAGRSPDAARSKPAQRCAVVGAVVQIAGVSHNVIVLPALTNGMLPGASGNRRSRGHVDKTGKTGDISASSIVKASLLPVRSELSKCSSV